MARCRSLRNEGSVRKFIIMMEIIGHMRRGIPACCLALANLAAAQPYPSKPITIIAPSSPGGPVDFTARFIAPPLSKILGQQVVIENRPGASQKIGMQALLRAPRDGYTLSVVSAASLTINPLLEPAIGYDPLKDFTLLTSPVASFSVLAVYPTVPS